MDEDEILKNKYKYLGNSVVDDFVEHAKRNNHWF